MGLLETIKAAAGGILEPVTKLIDDLHTSDAEKLLLKAQLANAQNDYEARLYEAETARYEAQSKVQIAEQQSDAWLSKAWRPIVGLMFAALMFLVFGLPAIKGQPVTTEFPEEFWYANLGILGVAIAGRSYEKGLKIRNGSAAKK